MTEPGRRDPDDVSDDVKALRERVAKGIEWLTANDTPAGTFHFWFTAGLLPTSPFPNEKPERIEAWKEYHRQRVRWERLSRDLERVDPWWGPSPNGG